MLANGIGVRQLATRSALYSDANEARSAEVVPGIPLASDAPGAPSVEPPMAAGQAGVGVGAGGGGGDEGVGEGVGVGADEPAPALGPELEPEPEPEPGLVV